jgi:hypothetical protein
MNYRFRAAKSFWRSWSRLSADQQQTARKAFQVFKQNPFDPRLRRAQNPPALRAPWPHDLCSGHCRRPESGLLREGRNSLVGLHRHARHLRKLSRGLNATAQGKLESFLIESKAGYSKLVVAPLLDFSHLSKSAWLSTVRNPPDMAEWPLPQSWAQLIW